MDIATTIRDRRAALGLTLEEVAEAVGVTKSTVRKWEHGLIRSIGNDKISDLASVLQLPVTALIEGVETKSAQNDADNLAEQVVVVTDDKMVPFFLQGDQVYYKTIDKPLSDGDVVVVAINKTKHLRFAYFSADGIKLHSGSPAELPEFYPINQKQEEGPAPSYAGLDILGVAVRMVRYL